MEIAQISPTEAWRLLEQDPKAQLVDVRCREEWLLVGVPDLASLGKRVIFLEWQDMAGNPHTGFIDGLSATVSDDALLIMLCRSGKRSMLAALAAAGAGYRAVNLATGFEGDLDGRRHRKSTCGWCADDLPWLQN